MLEMLLIDLKGAADQPQMVAELELEQRKTHVGSARSSSIKYAMILAMAWGAAC